MTNHKVIEVLRACLIIATIDNYITEEEYTAGLEYLEECDRFEEGLKKLQDQLINGNFVSMETRCLQPMT
jgi:hypothetical protein